MQPTMGTCRCKTSRYSSADGPLVVRYDGPVHRRDSSRRRSLRIFHEVWQQNCSFGKNGKRSGYLSLLESGAGDGNRTHVRSLGSFYTAIVRRPLTSILRTLYTISRRSIGVKRLSLIGKCCRNVSRDSLDGWVGRRSFLRSVYATTSGLQERRPHLHGRRCAVSPRVIRNKGQRHSSGHQRRAVIPEVQSIARICFFVGSAGVQEQDNATEKIVPELDL